MSHDLASYVFFRTENPATVLSRLAWYRTAACVPGVSIYRAEKYLSPRITSDPGKTQRHAQSFCPLQLEHVVHIGDPAALELHQWLRELWAPHLHRGNCWFHDEPLEPFVAAILAEPCPERAPGVPALPDELRRYERNAYGLRIARAKALHHVEATAHSAQRTSAPAQR